MSRVRRRGAAGARPAQAQSGSGWIVCTVGWFLPRIGGLSAPYYTERINYVLEVYR